MILIKSLGMLAIEYIFKRFRRVYNCAKFHKGEKCVLINVSKKDRNWGLIYPPDEFFKMFLKPT